MITGETPVPRQAPTASASICVHLWLLTPAPSALSASLRCDKTPGRKQELRMNADKRRWKVVPDSFWEAPGRKWEGKNSIWEAPN